MTKVVLSNLNNLANEQSAVSTINNNNDAIEAAVENTLSRDGTSPNEMHANLDMNSNRILNLPMPSSDNEPVIRRQLEDLGTQFAFIPNGGISAGTNITFSGASPNVISTSLTPTFTHVNKVGLATDGSIRTLTLNRDLHINGGMTLQSGEGVTVDFGNGGTVLYEQIGAFTNTRLAVTAGYTVQNIDKGKTIAASGNCYIIAFPAATGFDANYFVGVVNESTTRAKIVTLSGGDTLYLWPGQSCLVMRQGSSWYVLGKPVRWRKAGPDFYVDTANGSDTANDGLAAGSTGAFATIGKALSVILQECDLNNASPVIHIAAGTYTESVTYNGQPVGCNVIFFVGAGSGVVTWKPGASGYCLLISDNAEAEVDGIKFDNTGGANNCTGIAIHQTAVVDVLNDVKFGNFPGTVSVHISSDHGGFINLPASYSVGSAAWHLNAGPGTQVLQAGGGTITVNSGATVGILYRLVNSAVVFASAVTYVTTGATVTQSYSADALALLYASGSSVPGGAGVSGHGSQVY